MNRLEIDNGLNAYALAFESFRAGNQLPAEWFAVSDHFAIKCADAGDYEETCDVVASLADEEGVWQIELDGRYLASAGLASSVIVAGEAFSWVEIMQPRPGKETAEGIVEHTEFVFPDFAQIMHVLDTKNIAYELQENPGHRWVNIPLDKHGREIKINDKALADVVKTEKAEGLLLKRATRVKGDNT